MEAWGVEKRRHDAVGVRGITNSASGYTNMAEIQRRRQRERDTLRAGGGCVPWVLGQYLGVISERVKNKINKKGALRQAVTSRSNTLVQTAAEVHKDSP